MRIRLPGKWETGALASIAYVLVRAIGMTVRVKVENNDLIEQRLADGDGQVLVTWHGRSMVPLVHYRNRGLFALISPSRDGEIQYRLFHRFGWNATRGSTGRFAARAALVCVRRICEGKTLAIAPDGPKGPSGVIQPGSFFFAQKSGCPVVPAGVSASPAWSFHSWDRFLLPMPFARAAIVYGDPMMVPPDADEATLARLSGELEQSMDALQRRADELVGWKH